MRGGRTPLGERVLVGAGRVAVFGPLLVLGGLIGGVVGMGIGRLDLAFLTSLASRTPEAAGILPALVGSLLVVGTTVVLALPLGVGAAIHLEEYARPSRFTRLIELNIANLAGVPSVIYGLLGLELFVRVLGMGRSVVAGGATLALLVLPIVILASREALRTVPDELREAALALGATRWQVIRRVVLPLALPGILTGTILSVARALGETAPLIVVGAMAYMTFVPATLDDPFTVLPIQIFNWVSQPQKGFAVNAAAAILVLLVVMLALNGIAVAIRQRTGGRER